MFISVVTHLRLKTEYDEVHRMFIFKTTNSPGSKTSKRMDDSQKDHLSVNGYGWSPINYHVPSVLNFLTFLVIEYWLRRSRKVEQSFFSNNRQFFKISYKIALLARFL